MSRLLGHRVYLTAVRFFDNLKQLVYPEVVKVTYCWQSSSPIGHVEEKRGFPALHLTKVVDYVKQLFESNYK